MTTLNTVSLPFKWTTTDKRPTVHNKDYDQADLSLQELCLGDICLILLSIFKISEQKQRYLGN